MGFRLAGHILEKVIGITPTQKLVLLGLAERADGEGRDAFPSNRTLATYAVCSGRNVEIALKQLREGGWIGVQAKATNRKPTVYFLRVDRLVGFRGEESAPQTKNDTDSQSKSHDISGRGEESAPLAVRDEVASPQTPAPEPRGEVLRTAGANFSAVRGEESSPRSDPGSDPGSDPKTHTAADAAGLFGSLPPGRGSERATWLLEQFDRLWRIYPRGAAKQPAWLEFVRINPSAALVEEMLAAIEWQKRHVWGGVEPTKIPHLRTWLHQARWTDARDDIAPVSTKEFAEARRLLASKFLGRCPHPTVCDSVEACVKTIALREREQQHRRAS